MRAVTSTRITYHVKAPRERVYRALLDADAVQSCGWQLVHIALCKVMYHEWAFGAAQLRFPDLEVPHSVAQARETLEAGQQELRAVLVSLADDDLDRQVLTNWGARWPAWRIFWTMINHNALHGGAIGQLRDDYYWARARS